MAVVMALKPALLVQVIAEFVPLLAVMAHAMGQKHAHHVQPIAELAQPPIVALAQRQQMLHLAQAQMPRV